MLIIADWFFVLMLTLGMLAASRRVFHYFQLESYQFQGYFRTLLRQWKKAVLPYLLLGFLSSFVYGIIHTLHLKGILSLLQWVIFPVLYLAAAAYIRNLSLKTAEKKKFVVTARVKRLYVIYALLLIIIMKCMPAGAVSCVSLTILVPLLLALAAIIALPVEKLIFRMYFVDAQKMLLKNKNLIRIGITGSYGKTSVKFILNTILSQKYNVLCTPSSFNTPMGVTRIVRERLEASHQIFIGEMGARHVGEIKELCNLVHPSIGILTAVGPQHLDTFRTLDRIKKTKYELIEGLPEDGFAVFCNDDAIVTELYQKTSKNKVLVGKPESDAWADELELTPFGSTFTLHLKGEQPIRCQTKLLGEHNIQNIVASAAVAKHLNLTAAQIARGISQLQPVEHRLQLRTSPGGITVIDDAFNTNPKSSAMALNVLKAFPGRRIIVTPGMVELGSDEARYNREFGEKIADSADLVFLIGERHTKPIYEGLVGKNYPAENIHVCASLNDALAILNPMMQSGDVIMYENDLPDHYSEN